MSKLASLLAESDAALAALAGVDETAAPAAARAAGAGLARLGLAFEELGQAGASLLLDEMAALCRGAAAASGVHRAALVAAVRESFATLCATGLATRAAVEAVPTVNRLRALRAAAPVRLSALLPGAAPDDDPLLPDGFQQRARQWRTWFQKGLTGWLRGQSDSMELLRTAVSRVASLANGSPAHASWRAAALFVDALPAKPGAAAAADRQRLMRIDARLRALAEQPAAAFDDADLALTEELMVAVLGLRPHALLPRGAARAALLRHLRSDLALFRAELDDPAHTPRTVPSVARTVADTLALLEATGPRRRLLAVGERLRADGDTEAAAAELSQIMYSLEADARLAAGEPAMGPPPLLARELNALAEVLAETPASVGAGATPANASPGLPAPELLAAMSDLEEGRDRLESGVGAARRRLLDADDALAAMRETVLRLELSAGREAGDDELGTLRAQSTALATRFTAVHTLLRELQPPLAAQARGTLRLRRLMDTTTLDSLAPMLQAHTQRAAAAAGLRVEVRVEGLDEPLQMASSSLARTLTAAVDRLVDAAALAAPVDATLRLAIREARRGAWTLLGVELRGADIGGDDATAPPEDLVRRARMLRGSAHVQADRRALLYWFRLPHAESMRRLLRVEAGAQAWAVPVADVRAVHRDAVAAATEAPAGIVELGALLGSHGDAGDGPVLEIDADGDAAWIRVGSVEELTAGTPLALGAPLDGASWLAGAALSGEGSVLPVLDLEEMVLAIRQQRGTDGHV